MFKKVISVLMIFSFMSLTACGKSNFQTHSNDLSKRSLYHDTNKRQSLKYAFQALNKIMGFYEDQVKKSTEANSDRKLFTYTSYDKTGKKVTGKYEIADPTGGYVSIINTMTISASREKIIKEFAPIFDNICKDMINSGNAPKS